MGTFPHAIDVLLTKVNWKRSLIYLDNITIFMTTLHEHIEHI